MDVKIKNGIVSLVFQDGTKKDITITEANLIAAAIDRHYGEEDLMNFLNDEAGLYDISLADACPDILQDRKFIDEVLDLYMDYRSDAEGDNEDLRGCRDCLIEALGEVINSGEYSISYKKWWDYR